MNDRAIGPADRKLTMGEEGLRTPPGDWRGFLSGNFWKFFFGSGRTNGVIFRYTE